MTRNEGRKGMRYPCRVKRIDPLGYAMTYLPDHPKRQKNGYVYDHVLIAEKVLGKPLPPTTVMHHHPKNPSYQLVICQDHAYHRLIHTRMKVLKICGYKTWRKCVYCKQYDDPNNLIISRFPGKATYHRLCRIQYRHSRKVA